MVIKMNHQTENENNMLNMEELDQIAGGGSGKTKKQTVASDTPKDLADIARCKGCGFNELTGANTVRTEINGKTTFIISCPSCGYERRWTV